MFLIKLIWDYGIISVLLWTIAIILALIGFGIDLIKKKLNK